MNKFVAPLLGACVAASALVSASPAQASIAPRPNGWLQCREVTHGWLCINHSSGSNTYDVGYIKDKGSAATNIDFNLWCKNGKKYGDKGQFVALGGTTHTYPFVVGDQKSGCQGVLRNGSGGSVVASTPYVY